MAGSALDQGTLERLDQSAEIEMITPRRDGSASRRPIWVVVMDGDAYVRSYLGPRGAWYSRAAADGAGHAYAAQVKHTTRAVSPPLRATWVTFYLLVPPSLPEPLLRA